MKQTKIMFNANTLFAFNHHTYTASGIVVIFDPNFYTQIVAIRPDGIESTCEIQIHKDSVPALITALSPSKLFTVSLGDSDNPHVGTIGADTPKQLHDKLVKALAEHLNGDVEVPEISPDDCIFGKSFMVQVTNTEDDLDCEEEVFIEQTWLY